ncbi:MAG: YiiX/YebB-like N1pC/P60 family cysteine hydrolase [bacterium]|nr:YiiX/YebB-like N1pC/P60 family cysteine hydrolase [bacterium]
MRSKFITLMISLIVIYKPWSNLPFQPKLGDFVFQNLSSNFASGVSGATDSIWSHVGIIDEKDNQFVVIEANFKGVIETPLNVFLQRCKNRYSVVRLSLSDDILSRVVSRAKSHLGKNYDYLFRIDEVDTLYCSELIFDALDHTLSFSNPISPKPMDFSGAIDYWTKYFERHGSQIPQGAPGVSPHDLFLISGGSLIFHYDKTQLHFHELYDL